MPNIAIIGMSTGGPKTLGPLFDAMPAVNRCIILVQHMPQFINEEILAAITRLAPGMHASIARQGDRIKPGMLYIAPGAVLISAVMTGMGCDGAAGIHIGAVTFAQNEQSCAVFGMPKAAIQTG